MPQHTGSVGRRVPQNGIVCKAYAPAEGSKHARQNTKSTAPCVVMLDKETEMHACIAVPHCLQRQLGAAGCSSKLHSAMFAVRRHEVKQEVHEKCSSLTARGNRRGLCCLQRYCSKKSENLVSLPDLGCSLLNMCNPLLGKQICIGFAMGLEVGLLLGLFGSLHLDWLLFPRLRRGSRCLGDHRSVAIQL